MEDDTLQDGKLIDDLPEVIVAEIAIILTGEQGSRTLLAKFITAAGRLDVD